MTSRDRSLIVWLSAGVILMAVISLAINVLRFSRGWISAPLFAVVAVCSVTLGAINVARIRRVRRSP